MNEYKALMSLEESRIEHHGVVNFPNNRVFLRAAALEIVMHDINESADEHLAHGVRAVAGLAALTCARADAGSLDASDVEEIKTILVEFLGTEIYAGLRDIWLRFQAHDRHTDPTVLYALAREWEKLLADLAVERDEPESPTKTGPGSEVLILIDGIIEDIKEALEEAAKEYLFEVYQKQFVVKTNDIQFGVLKGFEAGAKWQQERSYSEEEVIDLLQKMNDWPTICEGRSDIEEWFEQFKKK
jgi:hypothetical protein